MGRLDIPEMLILFFLCAGAAWAFFNWTHHPAGPRR